MDDFLPLLLGIGTYFITRQIVKREDKKVKHGVCRLGDFGKVSFLQLKNETCKVTCDLKGIKTPGLHGLHVHKYGDINEGCKSTCSHYNPDNTEHGGPKGKKRHRGDLGNIFVDEYGKSDTVIFADLDLYEIIGRGLILHEKPDDLGLADNEESKKTGNAGERIACGVIGISKS